MAGTDLADMLREAMLTAGMVAAPVLLVGLLVGLALGILSEYPQRDVDGVAPRHGSQGPGREVQKPSCAPRKRLWR